MNNGKPVRTEAGLMLSVAQGGRNAILFCITQDLIKGYEAVTGWLAENAGYKITSLSAQAVNINAQLAPGVTGFGITAIAERVLLDKDGPDRDALAFQLQETLTYARERLTDTHDDPELVRNLVVSRLSGALDLVNEYLS